MRIVACVAAIAPAMAFVRPSVPTTVQRPPHAVEDPDEVSNALAVVSLELASTAARGSVAAASALKLDEAFAGKAKAEGLLRSALESVRGVLRSELEAAAERETELARTVSAYDDWEKCKRTRAATERELMASLTSVASLTPESDIVERLTLVADAKAEIVAVDSALADEFADAKAALVRASQLAASAKTHLAATLNELPDPDADADDVRAHSWADIAAALDAVRDERDRASDAADAARRLEEVIHKFITLRAKALQLAVPDAQDEQDDVPTFKEAAKEVASASLETAAAFGDWVLSDQPEQLAYNITSRLRSRANSRPAP